MITDYQKTIWFEDAVKLFQDCPWLLQSVEDIKKQIETLDASAETD